MERKLLLEDYRLIYRIRKFETTVLELFSQNKLTGTTHTCIGQEATPVALAANLEEQDCIFSNHRCHGYFISYAKDYRALMAEIMGKVTGVCRGRGGSQHLCYKNFYSNGVQGGIVPNATGIAFAEKQKRTNAVSVVTLGDGTLGQGVVYESMNMAAIYQLPILYLVEDNGYAMTTPSDYAVSGSIVGRACGFGIKAMEITSNDTEELRAYFSEAVSYVRTTGKPICCAIHTYRLGPHSKGDDPRDPAEVEEHKKYDPLTLLEQKLSEDECVAIREEEDSLMEKVLRDCERDETEDTFEVSPERNATESENCTALNEARSEKGVTAINNALREQLQNDGNCFLFGEDICDPYGGAFKATKGLSTDYPNQVINTPISEAGMIGMAVGMAMRGMHPIIEMMFGDFLSMGFDQLLNHAGKYHWMYAEQVTVPMLIRAPMGGRRGYGATHSQCLEKYFIGIPGIDVIALSPLHAPTVIMRRIFQQMERPVLLIEDKAMYGQRLLTYQNGRIGHFAVQESASQFPIVSLTMDEDDVPTAAIITYGAMTMIAMAVAERLMMENEILAKVVVLTKIAPVDYNELAEAIGGAEFIVTMEEGTKRAGVGAEIVAALVEKGEGRRYLRIAAPDCPIPCNKVLEIEMLPSVTRAYEQIKEMV